MSELDAGKLERGEVITIEQCPFPLPKPADLEFLRSEVIRAKTYHDVQYDPTTQRIWGAGTIAPGDLLRIEEILADFSQKATDWLTGVFPFYASDLLADQASLRVHEEATRSCRHSGRNDVLHIDSFPNRPTGGKRVLRVYTNFNQTEDRVWAVGETFPVLLQRYPQRIPIRTRDEWMEPAPSWQRLLLRDWSGRPAYDTFMYRLEEFLKTDEKIQEKILKRYLRFPPGSTWLVFGDGVSHAVLRGQFALEHSFFIGDSVLVEPKHAPLTHLLAASRQHQSLKAG
jgi:hypothetical protein